MEARELEALLARVESATGPDREIDLALMILGWGGPRERYLTDELDRLAFGEQWKFTASLDAALALVERVMGERSPLVGVDRNYGFDNDIPGSEETPRWNAWCYGEGGEHPTSPAIALLIALLRAKAKDAQQAGSPQAIDTGVK